MRAKQSNPDRDRQVISVGNLMSEMLRVLAYPAYAKAQSNPYNALLYLEMAAQGASVREFSRRSLRKESWDIFHTHWPHLFIDRRSRLKIWKSARKTLELIDRAKARGTKLIYTVHNLEPHEVHYQRIEHAFWSDLFARMDGLIGLAHAGLDEARNLWPSLRPLPAFVIPHGHYRDVYPRPFGRDEARRRLGIDERATVIACIGQIRPYKNVAKLIESFRVVQDDSLFLTVCGRPLNAATEAEVRTAADGDPRVRLRLEFLPDFEIAWNLIAADLVVLPYAAILNSGSALLALSFNRPVVVPALGAMPELQDAVGTDWIRTFTGVFDPDVLRQAIDWAKGAPRTVAPLEQFDWPIIARKTVEAYRHVMEARESEFARP